MLGRWLLGLRIRYSVTDNIYYWQTRVREPRQLSADFICPSIPQRVYPSPADYVYSARLLTVVIRMCV